MGISIAARRYRNYSFFFLLYSLAAVCGSPDIILIHNANILI